MDIKFKRFYDMKVDGLPDPQTADNQNLILNNQDIHAYDREPGMFDQYGTYNIIRE